MLKKIVLETTDANGTSKTTIDLTEYTEMVIKMTVDGVVQQLKDWRKNVD